MRRISLIILCFILGCPEFVRGQDLVPTGLPQSCINKLSKFTGSLNRKKKSETKIVKTLFHKAHRDFLKKYHAYATVGDIFKNGSYDCLSGTYFLSTSLTHLGIKHRIIETNYHIFLIAETDQGDVLMESTDRYQGLVTDPQQIAERIENYKTNRTDKISQQLYLSHIKIYHEIFPLQLSGLSYFNLAVDSYHRNDFVASCRYLQSAWQIYDNPRIEAFTPILTRSIVRSQLSEQQKVILTGLLKSYAHQSLTAQAIR